VGDSAAAEGGEKHGEKQHQQEHHAAHSFPGCRSAATAVPDRAAAGGSSAGSW
jgi:hypothetical protein